ncbi:FAD/NAD-P-binding domain-containing protein [Mycena alexandri]|uniref:FAD/NAD-P-binding domain-containing protein n=1 Tax=Mycena alexandri TaxID=1745969 RepID=A0AAD6SNE4_9AGAR|nr:FAD/NAD-P-binding domain-containing protein [Mycena alexandri]
MNNDEDATFDIIVLGTGLTESIAAAALSKAGYKVAHLDRNEYYGSGEASLSFEEFIKWQDKLQPFIRGASRSGDSIEQARAYSISLSPSLIPSTGPLIDALVASGVSRYGGFRLIERVCVYEPSGIVKPVPGSKEDIFKNKDISLLDKRRLMRFLMFAAGDLEDKKELEGHADSPFPEFLKAVFSLNEEMTGAIAYALAYCLSPTDPTLPALHRLRRYLRSAGRYGASPFLVGHYGSSGEIAQGFCRTAAVSGAVYILGRNLSEMTISSSDHQHVVQLDDFDGRLTASLVIHGSSYAPLYASPVPPPQVLSAPFSALSPNYPVARCVAIIDRPLSLGVPATQSVEGEEAADAPPPPVPDTAVIVFPPGSLSNGGSSTAPATVLIVGEGTMSCPKGKWIVYLALPLVDTNFNSDSTGAAPDPRVLLQPGALPDPRALLQPYLDAVLALALPSPGHEADSPQTPPTPLFSTFYVQTPHRYVRGPPSTDDEPGAHEHLAPVPLPPVFPLPDAGDAAAVHAESVFWEAVRVLKMARGGGEGEEEITSMWPPMESREEEEEEDFS